jgi:hypothetical protein
MQNFLMQIYDASSSAKIPIKPQENLGNQQLIALLLTVFFNKQILGAI